MDEKLGRVALGSAATRSSRTLYRAGWPSGQAQEPWADGVSPRMVTFARFIAYARTGKTQGMRLARSVVENEMNSELVRSATRGTENACG